MNIKKQLGQHKGMTLVEVVVAIAIIGIIATAFVPLFASSVLQVFRSGDRSEALYDAQEYLAASIDTGVPAADTEETDATIVITFDATNCSVVGRIFKTEVPYGSSGNTVILRAFLPD
jgi:prepilin-type N-terminal cleavage/methylation domain-containing protein